MLGKHLIMVHGMLIFANKSQRHGYSRRQNQRWLRDSIRYQPHRPLLSLPVPQRHASGLQYSGLPIACCLRKLIRPPLRTRGALTITTSRRTTTRGSATVRRKRPISTSPMRSSVGTAPKVYTQRRFIQVVLRQAFRSMSVKKAGTHLVSSTT